MTDTMQSPAHHCTKPLLCAGLLEVRRTVQVFQPVHFTVCTDTAQCTAMQVRSEREDKHNLSNCYQTQHIIQGYFNQLCILFHHMLYPKNNKIQLKLGEKRDVKYNYIVVIFVYLLTWNSEGLALLGFSLLTQCLQMFTWTKWELKLVCSQNSIKKVCCPLQEPVTLLRHNG